MIRKKLAENLSAENILAEVKYFKRAEEKSFERTYGWAWLLKLAEELHTCEDPWARDMEKNLRPLTDLVVQRHLEFLPKLVYPIRVGEHSNTAFGLAFAWDYAGAIGNRELKDLIEKRARDFYLHDRGCPLTWEPSGYDFLSPCLEEADIMRRVLAQERIRLLAEKVPAATGRSKNFHSGPRPGLRPQGRQARPPRRPEFQPRLVPVRHRFAAGLRPPAKDRRPAPAPFPGFGHGRFLRGRPLAGLVRGLRPVRGRDLIAAQPVSMISARLLIH